MSKKIKPVAWISCALFSLISACLPLAAQYSLECEWISPQPSGNSYKAVWGTSPANVFFAGQYGAIVHYNGTTFSHMSLPAGLNVDQIWGLWGSSASNLYAVGDPSGSGGLILRYNGSAWSNVTPAGLEFALRGVWGAGPSAIFAVGNAYWNPVMATMTNDILFFNGSAWTRMNLGVTVSLNSVWGTSASDVFAVGTSGTIFHYDGSAWSSMTSPTPQTLYSVWGASGSDVYAVGSNGTVIHYDGSNWSANLPGVTNALYGVWGESGSDVYAVGGNGRICHWNGSGWVNSNFWGNHFYGIYGFAGTPYFAAGDEGRILRCDTGTWGQIAPSSRVTSRQLNGIWGSSASNIYVTGSSGTIFHYNGSSWTDQSIGGTLMFYRIWGRAANDIYAVGGYWITNPVSYAIYHFDGTSWSQVASGSNYVLFDVWGSGSVDGSGKANDVYAVGGTRLVDHPPADDYVILHYDGQSWSVADSGSGFHATGIWGSASVDGSGRADDVFVSGTNTNESGGFIRHFNGTSWSTTALLTAVELGDVWGSPRLGAGGKANDVFAVGWNGRPFHYDGSAWSEIAHDGMSSQAAAAWGLGADSLFIAANSGPVFFDGTNWAEKPFLDPNFNGLNDIWGTSTSNVYAVGEGGAIIRIRLVSISPQPVNPNQAPVAEISGDALVCHPPQAVRLDGSPSGDADGRVAAYEWKLASRPAGSAAALSAGDTAFVTFTADLAGRYVVTLRVRDDDGAWSATVSHAVTASAGDPPGLTIQGARKGERAWIIRKDYAELTLTTAPPASGCALPLSGYRLQRRRDQGAFTTVKDIAPGDFTLQNGVLSCSLTDKYLEKKSSYAYRLAALDASGQEVAATEIGL